MNDKFLVSRYTISILLDVQIGADFWWRSVLQVLILSINKRNRYQLDKQMISTQENNENVTKDYSTSVLHNIKVFIILQPTSQPALQRTYD